MPRISSKFGQGGANLTGGSGEPSLAEVLDTVTREVGDPVWATQEQWFIDPVGGNDSFDGSTSLRALKSMGELARRLKNQFINQTTTIWVLNDVPRTDAPLFQFHVGEFGFVRFRGQRETLRNGTFTSTTSLDVNNNQAVEVVDSTLTDSWTNLGLLGKRIRITSSGARENAIAWIAKDLGSKQARTSVFLENPWTKIEAGDANYVPLANPDPQVDDEYVVEELTNIEILQLDIVADSTWVDAADQRLVFEDLQIARDQKHMNPIRVLTSYFGVVFVGCDLFNVVPISSGPLAYVGCKMVGFQSYGSSWLQLYGGLCIGSLSIPPGSLYHCHGIPMAQGITVTVRGLLHANLFGIFDSPSHGVSVYGGGCLEHGRIFGAGNAGYGVKVYSLGGLAYDVSSKPNIVGTSGDALVGGTAKTWAEIPYVDTATNAAIVVQQ